MAHTHDENTKMCYVLLGWVRERETGCFSSGFWSIPAELSDPGHTYQRLILSFPEKHVWI